MTIHKQYATTEDVFIDEDFINSKPHLLLPSNVKRLGEGGLRKNGYLKSEVPSKPIVTIIIATFNASAQLAETIESVIWQNYRQIELIIIDGGSKDKTIDVLKRYDLAINYWVSEPDEGIADAFNKGVKLAQGAYLNFQGAGDFLLSNDVVGAMMADINPLDDMLVCGRIKRVADTNDKELLYIAPKYFNAEFDKRSLLLRMSLPHQALFTNQQFFKEYGLFDKNCIFAMDYEHLLRAYHAFPKVVMRDVLVSAWRAGGVGQDKTLEIFKEYNEIKMRNNVASKLLLVLIHKWILMKYYLKNCLCYLRFIKLV